MKIPPLRMFCFFKTTALAVVLCFCGQFNEVKASTSSIIIDAWSGEVLSASSADVERYPASLTKLMTLYITFDALEKGIIKLDDELPVSRNAANRSPSKLGVRAGSKIKVKTAIMALIVKSANDCATVLAEGLGYTEENFALTMTKVAHELGMKNTTFKNASGLPNRAQKTTARDMALLGAAVYHHFPQYYKLFSAKSFEYDGRKYYTHNYLLKSFDGADGMKTGFTSAAGYNIVTSAERNGKRVIAVTMGHNNAKTRDKNIAKMMDKGLTLLALEDKVTASKTYASLDHRQLSVTEEKETASVDELKEIDSSWGVQLGAFSNYAKARNYALAVQNRRGGIIGNKTVNIEPYKSGEAIIYRSRIVGFSKEEAENFCNKMKNTQQSCIIVANAYTPENYRIAEKNPESNIVANKELLMAHKL